jgi:hypothetical protein
MKFIALFSGWNEKDWRIFPTRLQATLWLSQKERTEKRNFPNKKRTDGWIYEARE